MAFGLAEFNFDEAFKYWEEDYGEHINIIFAYMRRSQMFQTVEYGLPAKLI